MYLLGFSQNGQKIKDMRGRREATSLHDVIPLRSMAWMMS